jgi:mono/diheme cytochrome c family protein
MDKALSPLLLLVALVLPVVLCGCGGDAYSASMEYGVREDPLVLNEKLGPERYEPDRPGLFPLFSVQDLKDQRNPLYKEGETLLREEKLRDPNKLTSADRQELAAALKEVFGTPAKPTVREISDQARDLLRLGDETLALGSRLFRNQCVHCHGVTGDGRGVTAKWMNPHPRDYRQGIFKFQSVDQAADNTTRPPRREDLRRTLERGIEGTAMPTFADLPGSDLDALVSYVIHLSIRGKAEYDTIKQAFDYDPKTDTLSRGEEAPGEYLRLATKKQGEVWLDAQDDKKKIEVKPYPYAEAAIKDSVRRGQALFLADETKLKEYYPKVGEVALNKLKAASCVSCHLDYGRKAPYKFDSWGTLLKPANLTLAVYRGGRRPHDLYYRIHSGINGSGMANFGSILDENQIWDLINFIQALPYPAMRDRYDIQID